MGRACNYQHTIATPWGSVSCHVLLGSSSSESAAKIGDTGVLGGGISPAGTGQGDMQPRGGFIDGQSLEFVRRRIFTKEAGTTEVNWVPVDNDVSFTQNKSCICGLSCTASGAVRKRGEGGSRDCRGMTTEIC